MFQPPAGRQHGWVLFVFGGLPRGAADHVAHDLINDLAGVLPGHIAAPPTAGLALPVAVLSHRGQRCMRVARRWRQLPAHERGILATCTPQDQLLRTGSQRMFIGNTFLRHHCIKSCTKSALASLLTAAGWSCLSIVPGAEESCRTLSV